MAIPDESPVFPSAPGPLSDMPPEYAERRGTNSLGRVGLRSGHQAVLLVTHADVAAARNDVRLSHDLTEPASARPLEGMSFRDDPEFLLNLEGGNQAVAIAVRAGLTDETVYDDPEAVRFGRKVLASLYFGGGLHCCIGAHLAKDVPQSAIAMAWLDCDTVLDMHSLPKQAMRALDDHVFVQPFSHTYWPEPGLEYLDGAEYNSPPRFSPDGYKAAIRDGTARPTQGFVYLRGTYGFVRFQNGAERRA